MLDPLTGGIFIAKKFGDAGYEYYQVKVGK